MIIYQPVSLHTDQSELSRLAAEVARNLIPRAKILSSQAVDGAAHLLLKETETLSAFDLFNRELGEEAFEIILRVATDLEWKRKEQNDPLLKSINVYVLAKGFSKDFLIRVPFGIVSVCLFEWNFICSEANEAVLVREITKDMSCEKTACQPAQAASRTHSQRHLLRQELSTPELVAFARLGIELRDRRSQDTRPH